MVIKEDILNILHVGKHYFVITRRIASYLSRKISVRGLVARELVPRRNSRRSNQDQLESIPRLIKLFIEDYPG